MSDFKMNPEYAERLAEAKRAHDAARADYQAAQESTRAAQKAFTELVMEAWGVPVGARVADHKGVEYEVTSGCTYGSTIAPSLYGRKIKKDGSPAERKTYIGAGRPVTAT